ncbi:carbohydrate porin [Prochlorococcus marinus]|uniref:carbohydrate porin n=1 Tax=Prochlorococcus marinus TaxID=1219 RepID=UPI001ADB7B3D|nr:carbohydrate porin [Prochlorococcus marinus]MBO8205144.1 hypothetical protein [Prochlorococcus marinus CUG1415]MBW3044407.1 hypothetical protein [Prochlorococcus marinus str. MU1415]
MKLSTQKLFAPALVGTIMPLAIHAGGMNHHDHHMHDDSHMNMNDSFPSTMFMGKSTFVLGGVDGVTGREAVTFNYDLKLMGMTSFTGEDMLMTAIRAGNFNMMAPFGMMGASRLDTAFNSTDNLEVHKLFYKFPLGDNFKVTFGPKLRQDDLLGVKPTSYPGDDGILFVLNQAGANDTYSKKMGAGAGVTYSKDNLIASTVLVSENASSTNGILTNEGSDIITTQLAWVDDSYTLAFAYTYSDGGNTDNSADANDYSSYGINGTYNFFNQSDALPSSISAGFGWKNPDNDDNPDTAANSVEDGNTWTIGMFWNDVIQEGNNLGFAIGTAETHRDDDGYDNPLAWETFYQMQINDSISITPSIFSVQKDGADDVTGVLVKTSFKF